MARAAKKKTINKKKAPKTKALTTVGTFAVSNDVKFDPSILGASEKIDQDDIQIPKILLMADMSDLVKKQKIATPGEFRDKSTGELISDEAGFDCFVISKTKLWQIFGPEKNKKGDLLYTETLPFEGNEDLAFDDKDDRDNVIVHRDKVLRFYVILLTELAEGMAFPYAIDFKRTSRQAGMDLSRFFFKMRQKGIPSYGMVFKIFAQEDTSPDGFEYHKKMVSMGRGITKDELLDVQTFAKTVTEAQVAQRITVDDDGETSNLKEVKGKVTKSSRF